MNLVKKIPWGKETEINVVIEIPKGSSNKYEYDCHGEYFRLDRTLHTAMFYPFDYGFMPQSNAEDGDPLDVIVLTEQPTFPGCVIKSRPVGMLRMTDEKGEDIKILAVPTKEIEPRKDEVKDIKNIPEHQRKEIKDFIEHHKKLEPHKWVKIDGFENADKAHEVIRESANNFKKRAKRRK
jgi:inorganic pyrophosphatase